MNNFFTSDCHFWHKQICKFASRPFSSTEEMNEALIANWNSVVTPKDTVYHLGDFCFAGATKLKEILGRLNGTKILILGNHDKNIWNTRKQILEQGLAKEILSYKEIKVNGHSAVLFHYGQRVWNKQRYGAFHMYGHSHGALPPHGKSVDVGVDSHWITGQAEYRPFAWEEIKAYLGAREIYNPEVEPSGKTCHGPRDRSCNECGFDILLEIKR